MEPWSEQFELTVRANLLSIAPNITLTSTTNLASLQLDSLSVMALVTSLEGSFKVTLPPTVLSRGRNTTLGELWAHCSEARARRQK